MERNAVIIELHYLPSLEYFTIIEKFDRVILEATENFIKQSYRNRCHILTANKIAALTVPVREGTKKVLIKDIRIDYDQKWVNNHWRAISSAYGKAPFFEHYSDFFREVIFKRHKFLFDLNHELLTLCLKLVGIVKPMSFSESFNTIPENGMIDCRSVVHPKKNYEKNGFYKKNDYYQVFGSNFAANLSIIDLIFCEGTQALQVLRKSVIN